MVGPPGFTKLGANWVEVTVWGRMKMRFNQRQNDLKTWPATTRRFRSDSDDEQANGFQVGVAFPHLRKAAGVGQPFTERFSISNCRLPIDQGRRSNWQPARMNWKSAIQKLAITYVM